MSEFKILGQVKKEGGEVIEITLNTPIKTIVETDVNRILLDIVEQMDNDELAKFKKGGSLFSRLRKMTEDEIFIFLYALEHEVNTFDEAFESVENQELSLEGGATLKDIALERVRSGVYGEISESFYVYIDWEKMINDFSSEYIEYNNIYIKRN